MTIPLNRRVACIDFDGVIVEQGVGVNGRPLPGVTEALRNLRANGWRIIVCTARCHTDELFIEPYLNKYGIPYDEVTTRKPQAHVYVDDRAVRFDGDWKKTLREVLEFEPYYHREELSVNGNGLDANTGGSIMITVAELRAKYHPPYRMDKIEDKIQKTASMGITQIYGYEPYRLASDLRLALKEAGYKLIAEENGSLTISWAGGKDGDMK